mmetsp:Transcript_943/g.3012  ORF Transcript_943/g.3012 Transcript_943/m.3012 type:complete len:212 (+) Transcript_943:339-974(+)
MAAQRMPLRVCGRAQGSTAAAGRAPGRWTPRPVRERDGGLGRVLLVGEIVFKVGLVVPLAVFVRSVPRQGVVVRAVVDEDDVFFSDDGLPSREPDHPHLLEVDGDEPRRRDGAQVLQHGDLLDVLAVDDARLFSGDHEDVEAELDGEALNVRGLEPVRWRERAHLAERLLVLVAAEAQRPLGLPPRLALLEQPVLRLERKQRVDVLRVDLP